MSENILTRKIIIQKIFNSKISRFTVPSTLHSDQGANLTSQVALCKILGIECTQSTAYHPQGNGQVEHLTLPWRQCYWRWSGKTRKTGTCLSQRHFLHTRHHSTSPPVIPPSVSTLAVPHINQLMYVRKEFFAKWRGGERSTGICARSLSFPDSCL